MKTIKLAKLTKEQYETFSNYFTDEKGEYLFEGMWLRNQCMENASQSCYKDETTQRRRYIHFYDKYIAKKDDTDYFLSLKSTYIVVSNTLPKNEILEYKKRIFQALEKSGFKKVDNKFLTDDMFEVFIMEYDNHPKNKDSGATFPNNYSSIDIVFITKNNDWKHNYDRMWRHSTKMIRIPDKRGNPTYETDLEVLKKYLPAQIEMGCGPSIETDIPPLYEMHETYKVQNHKNKKFYFGSEDTLMEEIIKNPEQMYKKFAKVPLACLQAKHSQAYNIFKDAYQKELFTGTLYNNNFDRLVKRLDIDEQILRVYERDIYIPKIKFDKSIKSLICIGCHADRREVQKQAREQGLKVIFVDPEGFIERGVFKPYPIEGPQDKDIIFKMTFTEFMKKFETKFL